MTSHIFCPSPICPASHTISLSTVSRFLSLYSFSLSLLSFSLPSLSPLSFFLFPLLPPYSVLFPSLSPHSSPPAPDSLLPSFTSLHHTLPLSHLPCSFTFLPLLHHLLPFFPTTHLQTYVGPALKSFTQSDHSMFSLLPVLQQHALRGMKP